MAGPPEATAGAWWRQGREPPPGRPGAAPPGRGGAAAPRPGARGGGAEDGAPAAPVPLPPEPRAHAAALRLQESSEFSQSSRAPLGGLKPNLRAFLEKLGRRRRRIACSRACLAALRSSLGPLAAASSGGRVPYAALRELLRSPPPRVPRAALRELVDVARAYDATGDGSVDAEELLAGALDVEPGLLGRLKPVLPLIAILAWILMMPVVYCASTRRSFIDGLYLGVMLMSTVGSTEVVPDGLGLKLWTMLYVAVAALLLVWALVSCLNAMLVEYEAQLWALLSPRDNADLLADEGHGTSATALRLEELAAQEPCPPLLDLAAAPGATAPAVGKEDVSTAMKPGTWQRLKFWASQRKLTVRIGVSTLLIFLLLLVGTLLALFSSSQADFIDALYWSLLTCTTIGYGDLTFVLGDAIDSQLSRGLTLGFVICAVSGFMFAIIKIGETSLSVCSARMEAKIKSRSLPLDLLIDLDTNGTGVGKLEFMCAALMAMDKVSAHDLWQALEQFRRLDTEGTGELHGEHLAALRRHPGDQTLFRGGFKQEVSSRVEDPGPFQRLDFGDMSPVELQLDPTVGSSLDRTTGRRQLSVHFAPSGEHMASMGEVLSRSAGAGCMESVGEVLLQSTGTAYMTSVGEVLTASHVPEDTTGNLQGTTAEISQGAAEPDPLIKELYQENVLVRRQLGERQSELLGQLAAQRCTERALQQALAERQALHGQVLLLQQAKAELEAKAEREARRLEEAERRGSELEEERRGRHQAEQRVEELEVRLAEAQRQVGSQSQLLEAAEERARSQEQRAQEAEKSGLELMQHLQELENHWRIHTDARVNEVKLQFAEKDMQRQGEVKGALLELQMLRGEVQRGARPLPALPMVSMSRKADSGSFRNSSSQAWLPQTSWDSLPRLSSWPRQGGGLLSGRVREQAELLNAQWEQLQHRQDDNQPPGWV